ncbi:hypothetical protein CEXT_367401 [Caerostris extrusa]|uniref:Uncharacterized protein n=1 Tax=Caerostris extrusa TaxID=172846 RepID=A0AAV4WPI5_CAEEX|nr:hypothetical protein CEXT_367401 [Caerostris extrusa]
MQHPIPNQLSIHYPISMQHTISNQLSIHYPISMQHPISYPSIIQYCDFFPSLRKAGDRPPLLQEHRPGGAPGGLLPGHPGPALRHRRLLQEALAGPQGQERLRQQESSGRLTDDERHGKAAAGQDSQILSLHLSCGKKLTTQSPTLATSRRLRETGSDGLFATIKRGPSRPIYTSASYKQGSDAFCAQHSTSTKAAQIRTHLQREMEQSQKQQQASAVMNPHYLRFS